MMEFYHTYNRGVEKRKIFLENSDYFRGAHDLYEFNDVRAAANLNRKIVRFPKSNNELREKLVNITVSLARFFKNSEEYKEFLTNWLRYYEKNIQYIKKFIVE